MRLDPETPWQRTRRVGATILRALPNLAACLAVDYLGFRIEVALLPSWVAVVPVLLAVLVSTAIQWFWLLWVIGYVPHQEGQTLGQDGKVWHLTRSLDLVAQAQEYGHLSIEPARCRLLSRMLDCTRPMRPPRRATYVFTTLPGQGHARHNVPERKVRGLLELDANAVSGRIFTRRGDNALALLDGYHGPARVVTLGDVADGHERI